jgi:hypothetical protein
MRVSNEFFANRSNKTEFMLTGVVPCNFANTRMKRINAGPRILRQHQDRLHSRPAPVTNTGKIRSISTAQQLRSVATSKTVRSAEEISFYLLTPRSRFFLKQLSGFQLIMKFIAFHGTQSFITAFASARHLFLS